MLKLDAMPQVLANATSNQRRPTDCCGRQNCALACRQKRGLGALTRGARRNRAISLIETMFAAGILAISFLGLYAVSARASNLVRKSEAASDAQRNCLARIDQIRSYGWAKVSKPDQIAAILSQPTGGVTFQKEIISVYEMSVPQTLPLPSPTPAPTPAPSAAALFTVTKTGSGAPVISPAGFDPTVSLAKAQLNFRVLTEWNRSGRTEQREISTMISKSGSR